LRGRRCHRCDGRVRRLLLLLWSVRLLLWSRLWSVCLLLWSRLWSVRLLLWSRLWSVRLLLWSRLWSVCLLLWSRLWSVRLLRLSLLWSVCLLLWSCLWSVRLLLGLSLLRSVCLLLWSWDVHDVHGSFVRAMMAPHRGGLRVLRVRLDRHCSTPKPSRESKRRCYIDTPSRLYQHQHWPL